MQNILDQLKLKAEVVRMESNGTISKYYLRLRPGAKVSKIENCAMEIALGVQAYGKPLIRVIPEEGLVCIELLHSKVQKVEFNEFNPWFQFELIKEYGDLPIILGKKHDGEELVIDLAQAPHLLVAGSTGSGKSVLLHSIICSLIKSDSDVRLALIDPKQVEFQIYKDVKQLLYPIVSSPDDALEVLKDLIQEMDDRFVLLGKTGTNNIKSYNEKNKIPYIVAILDEFADLQRSYKKEFQSDVCVLAQKGRAAGIHLILATQRPSVNVIDGTIKANFASRIALKTASAIDSRVILDCNGAERLLGKGDALINSGNLDLVRFQSAYIDMKEIEQLCSRNIRKKKFWDQIMRR